MTIEVKLPLNMRVKLPRQSPARGPACGILAKKKKNSYAIFAAGIFCQQGGCMRYSLKDEFILAFCRLGVAGLSPKAPGTCGTALACLLAPFLFGPLDYLWRCIILVVLFVLGGFAATRAERLLHQKDPGQVVIDELVGVWLVILPFVKPGFWVISSAFVLFRVFDIIKPWPVSASENWLPNGFGVMIDDVMAGILALPFMGLLYWTGIF